MSGFETIRTADSSEAPSQETAEKRPDNGESYAKLEKTIELYFNNPDIRFSFKPGGFYINLETLVVNLDPDFTNKLNLGESGKVFGAFHEAEHFRDMMQDVDTYKKHFGRLKKYRVEAKTPEEKKYAMDLFRFYNILDDVTVNRSVQGRWAACTPDYLAGIYKKLFAVKDYIDEPEHAQFMNAIIRELMAPDELCDVSPKVREHLDRLKTTLEAASRFDLNKNAAYFNPATRYAILRSEIEPVFKELYTYVPPEKSPDGQDGEPGEGDALPGSLDQIDHDDLLDAIEKINESIAGKKNATYEKLLGVTKEEKDSYDKLYRSIEPQVQETVELFKQFISKRITEVRTKQIRTDGDLIPARLNEAYIRARAGELDQAPVFEKKISTLIEKPIFTDFELTIVIDGSGSMQDPGKLKAQQRATVMLLEAIVQFQDEANELNQQGEKISMDLKTQVREFSDKDTVLKEFNETLDYKSRVSLSKRLSSLTGGGNNEIDTLDAILHDVRDKSDIISAGELKKLIIVLTDGESDKDIAGKIAQIYRACNKAPNVKILGVGLGQGTGSVDTTYSPNGTGNLDLKQLPAHLAKSLIDFIAA
jgi:hypothetical protein